MAWAIYCGLSQKWDSKVRRPNMKFAKSVRKIGRRERKDKKRRERKKKGESDKNEHERER